MAPYLVTNDLQYLARLSSDPGYAILKAGLEKEAQHLLDRIEIAETDADLLALVRDWRAYRRVLSRMRQQVESLQTPDPLA